VGQKALGIIALKVQLSDLYTDALFHVIDADTSYNALLGQPWLHTSKAITSTLHQYLKYNDEYGNEKTIRRDANPFHREDVNYADAKFYKSMDPRISQRSLHLKGATKRKAHGSHFASEGHSSYQQLC